MQGQGDEGIAQLREGLSAYQSTGAEWARTYFLALLADALGQVGRPEEGLSVLAEALEFVEQRGKRAYEAEIYRLYGELTLQKQSVARGPVTEVEDRPASASRSPESDTGKCFQRAIEIAQKQQAKSFELRAVMNLSRLWQKQGKEARQLLADIYGWFTEGFDTKDLQEAKALLEELH